MRACSVGLCGKHTCEDLCGKRTCEDLGPQSLHLRVLNAHVCVCACSVALCECGVSSCVHPRCTLSKKNSS
ncbi:hypothetical protein DAI22_01g126401 [Oryza sativa Japonica Group]|nr:hypothetical protein DAI22_01g126401 [Oryza sativa Japonica Group]